MLANRNVFGPKHITINYGDTVVWFNADSRIHTTTSGDTCTPDGLWDSGDLAGGQSFTVIFGSGGVDTTGVIPYICVPHCFADMVGTVTVKP